MADVVGPYPSIPHEYGLNILLLKSEGKNVVKIVELSVKNIFE